MRTSVVARLRQIKDFLFDVDFGADLPLLRTDEPVPLGKGGGPNPGQLLAAAVGNCLAASLLFALRKSKQDPSPLSVESSCEVDRNERGRLRVQSINVRITLGVEAASLVHVDRTLATFEDFCTVSQSVSRGIPVVVSIFDSLNQKLK